MGQRVCCVLAAHTNACCSQGAPQAGGGTKWVRDGADKPGLPTPSRCCSSAWLACAALPSAGDRSRWRNEVGPRCCCQARPPYACPLRWMWYMTSDGATVCVGSARQAPELMCTCWRALQDGQQRLRMQQSGFRPQTTAQPNIATLHRRKRTVRCCTPPQPLHPDHAL